jgi:hypothetical protein
MKNNLLYALLLSGILLSINDFRLSAQETTKSPKINLGADLVSSYIWRGIVCDQSPNIQPNFSLGLGNFTLGAWASGNFTGTYKEFDLYASYAISQFTLTVTDYMWSPMIDNMPYFNYESEKTGHYFETSLAYKGKEKFPISILAATMVYGADKKIDKIDEISFDTTYVNNYSTYVELGYSLMVNGNRIDPFLGFTAAEGLYGDSFGITNLGLTGFRTLKISDKFDLPMKASIIFNPQASRAYFVLGITL